MSKFDPFDANHIGPGMGMPRKSLNITADFVEDFVERNKPVLSPDYFEVRLTFYNIAGDLYEVEMGLYEHYFVPEADMWMASMQVTAGDVEVILTKKVHDGEVLMAASGKPDPNSNSPDIQVFTRDHLPTNVVARQMVIARSMKPHVFPNNRGVS